MPQRHATEREPRHYGALRISDIAHAELKFQARKRGLTIVDFIDFVAANLDYLPDVPGPSPDYQMAREVRAKLERYRVPRNGNP